MGRLQSPQSTRRLLLLLISCFLLISESSCQLNCNLTVFGGPSGPGIDCVFPFNFNGRAYSHCTIASEGDKRPWCPTKVRPNGVHSLGSDDWGYCDPRCPFITREGLFIATGTTVKPGLRKDRPLIVPLTTRRPTSRPITLSTRKPRPKTTLDPASLAARNPGTHRGTWLPTVDEGQCGFSASVGYVIGGSQASRGDMPFLALLGYQV